MRFVLGRAGSGKTHYCLSKMAEAQKKHSETPFILLVPEQSTFMTERALATEFSSPGFCQGEIMSFSRLIHRAKLKKPARQKCVLSEMGKRMLIAKILYERQDDLRAFAASAKQINFPETVLQTISELKMYNISLADLRSVQVDELSLSDKLADICLLYEQLQILCGEQYEDSQDGLTFLADEIQNHDFLAGYHVLLDGFIDFTPQELMVIEALLQKAAQVEIALSLDYRESCEELAEGDLFYRIAQTKLILEKLANKYGVEIAEPVLCDGAMGRFAKNAELSFMEKEFLPLSKQVVYEKSPQQIYVTKAANCTEEVVGVAHDILYLVREKGLRYREIAVIARDVMPYEEDLKTIFSSMGIPFFVDSKKPLLYNPLVELIRSALEVAKDGWHYAPVFRFLKNSLSPLSLAEADVLENYCLAAGIRHYQWTNGVAWTFYPEDFQSREPLDLRQKKKNQQLAVINNLRIRTCDALLTFTQVFTEEISMREAVQAIRQFLVDLEVQQRLQAWQQQMIEQGDYEQASIYGQAWDKVVVILQEAEHFLGDDMLETEQVCSIFDVAFAGLQLSLVPPGLDQVSVSSLDRSRISEIKISFILGANNDCFPAKIQSEGVLSAYERVDLAEQGVILAPGVDSRQFEENYLIYVALTRATEQVHISYCLHDVEGKKMQPSLIILRLQEIFENLQEQQYAGRIGQNPQFLSGGYKSLSELAHQFSLVKQGQDIPEYWHDVYNYYLEQAEYSDILHLIIEGIFYTPTGQKLQQKSLQCLYGSGVRSSVSRLEKYRACPLAYFAAYGLKLRSRRVYQMSSMDRGQLFHEVLADVGRRIYEEKIEWNSIDENCAVRLVDDSLAKFLPQFLGNILASSARYKYLAERIRNTLVMAVMVMVRHMQSGQFEPLAWEVRFGDGGVFPSLKIPLSDYRNLEIFGQIDRIDMAVGEGKSWFRVVDYKTGNNKISVSDIFYGLKLQLLVYLHLVLENSAVLGVPKTESVAAGIYYSLVRDDVIGLSLDEVDEVQRELLGLRLEGVSVQDAEAVRLADSEISGYSSLIPVALKKDGSFYSNSGGITAEQMQLLREHLLHILQQTAEDMLEGLIIATPQNGKNFSQCQYCDFRDFCAFDAQMAEQKVEPPFLKKDDIWNILQKEVAKDE